MKAQEIILRLLQLKRTLTTFHVAKLAYMFDLACVQLFGEPRSGINYKWWHYGPWGEDLDRTIGALEDAGEIEVTRRVTTRQYACHVHRAATNRKPRLTKDEERLLQYVLKRFGGMGTDDLRRFVYSTPPMQAAQKRGARYESLNLFEGFGTPAAYYDPGMVRALIGGPRRRGKRLRSDEDVLAAIGA